MINTVCFPTFIGIGLNLIVLRWATSEHYFQAQKFTGTPYVEENRQAKILKEAAKIGLRSLKQIKIVTFTDIFAVIKYDAIF